ncbi:MAG: hypothetical protein R3D26_25070 [Cyanobacteriota/Melainabacteria group bacterium]
MAGGGSSGSKHGGGSPGSAPAPSAGSGSGGGSSGPSLAVAPSVPALVEVVPVRGSKVTRKKTARADPSLAAEKDIDFKYIWLTCKDVSNGLLVPS